MNTRSKTLATVVALLLAGGVLPALAKSVDEGKIRLGSPRSSDAAVETDEAPDSGLADPRRGFDYERFEVRLQTLWFQRKALLADGREADGARQSELIRAFCVEEGVGRLPAIGDALLVEADRSLADGRHSRAQEALRLAERLDPGRAQIRFAAAAAHWAARGGIIPAAKEYLGGVVATFREGILTLSLANQVLLILVVSVMGALCLFSLVMLARYQVPVRHEVEEWCHRRGWAQWSFASGWALLLLPFLVWLGAGWAAFYWIVITFRFMRRSEKLAAVAFLVATALAVPSYRVAVGIYGLTTDPVARTTLDAATGPYSPERIVKLRKMVRTHPDDPTYRFLLAGLYKNGRYFEDAFDEYKRALELDPGLYQALINIGNIYFLTGNFTESAAYYVRAAEVEPRSVLAFYNLHLAQAEAFRFAESREALDRATSLDSDRLTGLMRSGRDEGRAMVVDARVDLGSVWQAAFGGGQRGDSGPVSATAAGLGGMRAAFLNPLSMIAVVCLVVCLFGTAAYGRTPPARRCIRCGRPFCQHCKSGRQGHEYCNQCMHLFVLGDGLAPETKNRKLYEVQRHEARTMRFRRLSSLILPGASQFLRGRVFFGLGLMVAWFVGLLAWAPQVLRPVEWLTGLDVRLDLIRTSGIPVAHSTSPLGILGVVLVVAVWMMANLGALRRSES